MQQFRELIRGVFSCSVQGELFVLLMLEHYFIY